MTSRMFITTIFACAWLATGIWFCDAEQGNSETASGINEELELGSAGADLKIDSKEGTASISDKKATVRVLISSPEWEGMSLVPVQGENGFVDYHNMIKPISVETNALYRVEEFREIPYGEYRIDCIKWEFETKPVFLFSDKLKVAESEITFKPSLPKLIKLKIRFANIKPFVTSNDIVTAFVEEYRGEIKSKLYGPVFGSKWGDGKPCEFRLPVRENKLYRIKFAKALTPEEKALGPFELMFIEPEYDERLSFSFSTEGGIKDVEWNFGDPEKTDTSNEP